ncbi:MAG: methyl-accepting chemotaxis protein [Pseudomonadota bacterium]
MGVADILRTHTTDLGAAAACATAALLAAARLDETSPAWEIGATAAGALALTAWTLHEIRRRRRAERAFEATLARLAGVARGAQAEAADVETAERAAQAAAEDAAPEPAVVAIKSRLIVESGLRGFFDAPGAAAAAVWTSRDELVFANAALARLLSDAEDAAEADLERFAALRAAIDAALADAPPAAEPGAARRVQITFGAGEIYAVSVVESPGCAAGPLRFAQLHPVSVEIDVERQMGKLIEDFSSGRLYTRVSLPDEDVKNRFLKTASLQLNALCDKIAELFSDLEMSISAMASGDMTFEMTGDYDGDFQLLATNLNQALAQVNETIAKLSSLGLDIGVAASSQSQQAGDLANRAQQQNETLQSVAATLEQIAAAVRATSDNTTDATRLMGEMNARAESGGAVVRDAIDGMAEMERSSEKIQQITSVIDEIAFQTNLLALNAAVEAARAGEAGKGFAVVAAEVRALAQRSGDAAKDIGDLIKESGATVARGSALVSGVSDALTEIVSLVADTKERVDEVSLSTKEQSTGLEQISEAVSELDSISQATSAIADHSAGGAATLETKAQELAELVGQFVFNPPAHESGGESGDESFDAAEPWGFGGDVEAEAAFR